MSSAHLARIRDGVLPNRNSPEGAYAPSKKVPPMSIKDPTQPMRNRKQVIGKDSQAATSATIGLIPHGQAS